MIDSKARAKQWLDEAASTLVLATPVLEPETRDLAADIVAAQVWMIEVGHQLAKSANQHNNMVDYLLDKVAVIGACVSLPDDLPLRVRLFPNFLNLKA